MTQAPKPKQLISPVEILLSNLASSVDSSAWANGMFWKHECTAKLPSLLYLGRIVPSIKGAYLGFS